MARHRTEARCQRSADGVYVDCDPTIPFTCTEDPANQTCVARRNGHTKSANEAVSRATVEAYQAGKNRTLYDAFKLVEPLGGTFYNKGAPPNATLRECVTYDPAKGKGRTEGDCAGNIWWTGPKRHGDGLPPPPELHATIQAQRAIDRYVIVGGANSFSSPKSESLPPAPDGKGGQNISDGRSLKLCSEDVLAQFLLSVEPGAYLLCNSWDERFARPLGKPHGDATRSGTTWARSFEGGIAASWDTATRKGSVTWPGGWAPAQ